MTPTEAHAKRIEFLRMARNAEMADDIATGSWYRIFAQNFELIASDDPVKRERGFAMLKKNSDRFERRAKAVAC